MMERQRDHVCTASGSCSRCSATYPGAFLALACYTFASDASAVRAHGRCLAHCVWCIEIYIYIYIYSVSQRLVQFTHPGASIFRLCTWYMHSMMLSPYIFCGWSHVLPRVFRIVAAGVEFWTSSRSLLTAMKCIAGLSPPEPRNLRGQTSQSIPLRGWFLQ